MCKFARLMFEFKLMLTKCKRHEKIKEFKFEHIFVSVERNIYAYDVDLHTMKAEFLPFIHSYTNDVLCFLIGQKQ